MEDKKPLKLVIKCYDPVEYGTLYGFNQKISDKMLEKASKYMTKFTPALFKM